MRISKKYLISSEFQYDFEVNSGEVVLQPFAFTSIFTLCNIIRPRQSWSPPCSTWHQVQLAHRHTGLRPPAGAGHHHVELLVVDAAVPVHVGLLH